jgi:hypothetical protein
MILLEEEELALRVDLDQVHTLLQMYLVLVLKRRGVKTQW